MELNEQLQLEFVQKLPSLEKFYVLFSHLTRVPYMVYNEETCEDDSYLFTTEEAATAKAKLLTESGEQPCIAMCVENKDFLNILSSFFAYGITALDFTTEDGRVYIKLRDIIKRPDVSQIPENQRPLENAALQSSIIYYMQHLRKKDPSIDLQKRREMDEEMSANIKRATYLLPLAAVEQDGTQQVKHILFRPNESTCLVPLFSDGMEYQRFRGQQSELRGVPIDFEKLSTMEMPGDAKGFIINPHGVALILTKEYIAKIKEMFE